MPSYNHRTPDVKAGRSETQGLPLLHSVCLERGKEGQLMNQNKQTSALRFN